jgi:glycosyltransferase involved in cell wall biosynthesis
MKFSLIICTYQRPEALLKLLKSVQLQNLYPDQILVIDGSHDTSTGEALNPKEFPNLNYFKVDERERGLTKQRNYGIQKVAETSEIVCFLDDDIVLTPEYFQNLISTYSQHPDALGVGGAIIDEVQWRKLNPGETPIFSEFSLDGYVRKDSSRFMLRKKLGLLGNSFPTFMPEEGHGRSVGFLPPSNKIYKVETFMGGVASYRKTVFEQLKFSTYFEGYGLYEDTDFTLRCSKIGNLYVNTSAKLYHYHDEDGRPNQFKYGKMVVRNGWYVWRVRHKNPSFKAKTNWHLITWLLILIRFSNVFNTSNSKQAFSEGMGRTFGWISLIFSKPKVSIND